MRHFEYCMLMKYCTLVYTHKLSGSLINTDNAYVNTNVFTFQPFFLVSQSYNQQTKYPVWLEGHAKLLPAHLCFYTEARGAVCICVHVHRHVHGHEISRQCLCVTISCKKMAAEVIWGNNDDDNRFVTSVCTHVCVTACLCLRVSGRVCMCIWVCVCVRVCTSMYVCRGE